MVSVEIGTAAAVLRFVLPLKNCGYGRRRMSFFGRSRISSFPTWYSTEDVLSTARVRVALDVSHLLLGQELINNSVYLRLHDLVVFPP